MVRRMASLGRRTTAPLRATEVRGLGLVRTSRDGALTHINDHGVGQAFEPKGHAIAIYQPGGGGTMCGYCVAGRFYLALAGRGRGRVW